MRWLARPLPRYYRRRSSSYSSSYHLNSILLRPLPHHHHQHPHHYRHHWYQQPPPAWRRAASSSSSSSSPLLTPPPPPPKRRRSGTRISTVKVKEALPQGLLRRDDEGNKKHASGDEDASTASDQEPPYSYTIQQARDNMRRFASCVLITRVGGFYELYFEQAEKYAPLLGIKLASKRSGGRDAPMAGFPFFQLDRYLKMLVQDLHCHVAVSEEFPNTIEGRTNSGGLLFDRRVVRVISPGTLIDEKFLDSASHNFCLALYADPPHTVESSRSSASDEYGDSDGGLLAGRMALNKLKMADSKVGLAWLDLSTGESFVQSSTYAELPSLLTRISPREIVMDSDLPQNYREIILDFLGPEQMLVTWQSSKEIELSEDQWPDMFDSPMSSDIRQALSVDERRAMSMVLGYVTDRLQSSNNKLQAPVRRQNAENMLIDRYTLRGLEILEPMRGASFVGAKGSLLHAVRRTVTDGGARLLRDRITSPSAVLSTINHRLDLVEELVDRPDLKERVSNLLSKTFDTKRLVSKFSLGKGDPDDLISLSRTITLAQTIFDTLRADPSAKALNVLGNRPTLKEPAELSQKVINAIDEQGLIAAHEQEEAESSAVTGAAQSVLGSEGNVDDIKALGIVARAKGAKAAKPASDNDDTHDTQDGWIMRKSASQALESLHGELDKLNQERSELSSRLREEIGASTLTLQWAPKLGHFCHVRKVRDVQNSIARYPNSRGDNSPKKTTRSFHVSEWSELGGRLDFMKMKIRAEEQKIFLELRDEVVSNLVRLRRNAAILDELDVACSSASLAREQRAVRPVLDNGASLQIVGGRHPTVVLGLEERGRPFVANDCFMNVHSQGALDGDISTFDASAVTRDADSSESCAGGERIHLVTGPNMAGKSTFLRQNALLAVMAQVGLFVPAAHARIGLVDALFARIGSADNLFADQSTFMTEMLEVGGILRDATPRSLVVMDEVGRGTAPRDGVAVAYAALWHLRQINRCRALFATHFHDLADMTAGWDARSLGRYCTDVREAAAGAGAETVKETDLDTETGADTGKETSLDTEAGTRTMASSPAFVYLHKIRRGVNRNSHALKVAGLAGLPPRALDIARQVQADLGGHEGPRGPGESKGPEGGR